VRETERHGHYLVRSELHTFLSDVVKRELKRKPEETEKGLDLDRLEKRIREALMPHVLDTSDAVLHHLHPIDARHGFTSEIRLDEVDPQHLRPVRNLLTAGSGLGVVQRAAAGHFFVHADLYTTLARIRARELAIEARARLPLEGGALRNAAIADTRGQHRLLTSAVPRMTADPVSPGDGELRAFFEESLMSVLGLSATAFRKVVEPAIGGLALSAAAALKKRAGAHHGLKEELKLVESDNNRLVEQQQTALEAHYADDPRALDVLNETASDVRALLPALILLPEGGLFDRLVGALEEAQSDGRASGDEDFLLARLRKLKGDLEAMDWADQAAWNRVQRQIEHLNEIGSQPAMPIGDGAGPTKH